MDSKSQQDALTNSREPFGAPNNSKRNHTDSSMIANFNLNFTSEKKGEGVGNFLNLPEHSKKEGYVMKEGTGNKAWRKRWLIFEGDEISYYVKSDLSQKQGSIPFHKIQYVQAVQYKSKENIFAIILEYRTFYMQGNSPAETQSWISCILAMRDFWTSVPLNFYLDNALYVDNSDPSWDLGETSSGTGVGEVDGAMPVMKELMIPKEPEKSEASTKTGSEQDKPVDSPRTSRGEPEAKDGNTVFQSIRTRNRLTRPPQRILTNEHRMSKFTEPKAGPAKRNLSLPQFPTQDGEPDYQFTAAEQTKIWHDMVIHFKKVETGNSLTSSTPIFGGDILSFIQKHLGWNRDKSMYFIKHLYAKKLITSPIENYDLEKKFCFLNVSDVIKEEPEDKNSENQSSDDEDQLKTTVLINVGGQYFTISKETLAKHPDSYFTHLLSDGIPEDDGSYFIDRNYRIFELVLMYLREGHIHLPEVQKDIWKLKQESLFYKLPYLAETCDSILLNKM